MTLSSEDQRIVDGYNFDLPFVNLPADKIAVAIPLLMKSIKHTAATMISGQHACVVVPARYVEAMITALTAYGIHAHRGVTHRFEASCYGLEVTFLTDIDERVLLGRNVIALWLDSESPQRRTFLHDLCSAEDRMRSRCGRNGGLLLYTDNWNNSTFTKRRK